MGSKGGLCKNSIWFRATTYFGARDACAKAAKLAVLANDFLRGEYEVQVS